jgi:hypothetical protein
MVIGVFLEAGGQDANPLSSALMPFARHNRLRASLRDDLRPLCVYGRDPTRRDVPFSWFGSASVSLGIGALQMVPHCGRDLRDGVRCDEALSNPLQLHARPRRPSDGRDSQSRALGSSRCARAHE